MKQAPLAAITEKNFPAFLQAYNKAKSLRASRFLFQGQPVHMAYARYLIEYIRTNATRKSGPERHQSQRWEYGEE